MPSFAPLLLALASTSVAAGDWPADVESALMFAGPNRVEIERALEHYAAGDDAQKLDAVCFLVANMPGHGYVTYGLYDAKRNEVAYDALDYASYAEAQAAMDALEAEHGPLEFQKKELVEDLSVLTADDLIRDVDQAFAAWRGDPWAKDMTFETFREHVLPHRGSNEPLEDWRGPLMERVRAKAADLADDLAGEDGAELDPARMAQLAAQIASSTVGFSEQYYLHPTDQGFAEMSRERRGRCEDITNMTTYAMRAACVASAADYTPWWGHRDNNHAWPVVLDNQGRGRASDGNRAAKVYRKTYARQKDALCFQLESAEEAPRWLDRSTYRDVTDQYFDVFTVDVSFSTATEHRFAYLCVFNGGEWRPIHWARVDGRGASFDKMNANLLYLPAFYAGGEVLPAAAPIVVASDGRATPLPGDASETVSVVLPAKAGAAYELFRWSDGWTSVRKVVGGEGGVIVDGLPKNGLFWLVAEGSRRLERPFAIVDGGPVFL